jgi:hypothetical protein
MESDNRNHIIPSGPTLEMLGLSPSVNPMTSSTNNWYEYPGYFRSKAHCQLDLFIRGGGEKFTVAIVTELKKNQGLSITNAAEYIAAQLCSDYKIQPYDLILIEHYGIDRILSERYSLIRFKSSYKDAKGWHFTEPDWFPLEKSEVNRLVGIEVNIRSESAYE